MEQTNSSEYSKQEFMETLRQLKHRADAGVFCDIVIKDDPKLDAPMAVNLADHRKPVFIINREMCLERFSFTSIEMAMIISHELNHIYEDAQMKSTASGKLYKQVFNKHLMSK